MKPERVASVDFLGFRFVGTDADWLYGFGGRTVRRVSKKTGEVTQLAELDQSLIHCTLGSAHVYCASHDASKTRTLFRLGKSGSDPEQLAQVEVGVRSLAVSGTDLFVAAGGLRQEPSVIFRLQAGKPKPVARAESAVVGFVAGADRVFFSERAGVWGVPVAGGAATPLREGEATEYGRMAADGSHLYFLRGDVRRAGARGLPTCEVARAKKPTGAPLDLVGIRSIRCMQIAVGGGQIYVQLLSVGASDGTEAPRYEIWRLPVAGGAARAVAQSKNAFDLVADSSGAFYLERDLEAQSAVIQRVRHAE